jgi:hypothetical protein
MKCKDAKSFGNLQNDWIEVDLFSVADFAQLLISGLRRSDGIGAGPDMQIDQFGFDAQIDVGSILNKRTTKFRESLFSTLLEAAIDEGRRHRNNLGIHSSRSGDANNVASGQELDGIAYDGGSRPVRDVGSQCKQKLGDARKCPVDSQTLHLAIMGQDHEVIAAIIAVRHRAAGQCVRLRRAPGTCEHRIEKSTRALVLSRAGRRLRTYQTSRLLEQRRSCQQRTCRAAENSSSRGLCHHGAHRKKGQAVRLFGTGGRSDHQTGRHPNFGLCIRSIQRRTARHSGLPCQMQRRGPFKTHREN